MKLKIVFIMKKTKFIFKIILLSFLCSSAVFGEDSKYFSEGKKLFENKEFDESKFFFEKDIVFNPKSENSYLYLAKIFKKKEDDESEEFNLNSVLVLNPKNEEAIYMLMKLKVKQSNFSETEQLLDKFKMVCNSICFKDKEIEKSLSNLSTVSTN
tara:strand:- start:44 stop:508 length:465 start_codon:yes stop_codon:yes gene_type:complete